MMREYLNKLDRAVVKLHHDTNFQCIVISTDEVYHKLWKWQTDLKYIQAMLYQFQPCYRTRFVLLGL